MAAAENAVEAVATEEETAAEEETCGLHASTSPPAIDPLSAGGGGGVGDVEQAP